MRTQIEFFGVRGSIARPDRSTQLIGGNTSCVYVESNGTKIILDAGTGLFPLGRELISKKGPIKLNLLLTHFHWDHILGLPFFAPALSKNCNIDIYGRRGLKYSIEKLLSPPNFPITLKDLSAKIKLHEIKAKKFNVGKIKIEAFDVFHPNGALGYRLNVINGRSIVFISDNSPSKFDDRLIDQIYGADLLIHDAQYLPKEMAAKLKFGHSTYCHVLDLCGRANIKMAALFHHDPTRSDKEILMIEKQAQKLAKHLNIGVHIFAAREGQRITI